MAAPNINHSRDWEIFLEGGKKKKMSSILSPTFSLGKLGASVCLGQGVKVLFKKPFHFFQNLSEVQPEAERFLFKTMEAYLPLVVDQRSRSFKVFQILILFAALEMDGDPNISPPSPPQVLCKRTST